MIRHHLLIAGTGRAGTSLLVRILTACGLDTELSRNPEAFWDQTASAGLETIPLLPGEHPYVVKSPWSHQFIRQLLDDPTIALDGVIVPIRRLKEAASSRVILEIQQMYRSMPAMLELDDRWTEWAATIGGLTYSLQPLDAARILAHSFHRLIEALVEREVPLYFLTFPRFSTDLEYLHRVLVPVLPGDMDATTFTDRIKPFVERHKIRVTDEIAETKPEIINETSEPPYPELSMLYEVSLKREVKRLLEQQDAMAAERRQLQELLEAELRERISDCERLRQQIDSIHASICWRVTSPIRWFHKLVTLARSTLSKARLL
jgi:hypothetical protein